MALVNLRKFVELVDWTGRAIRDNQRGAIASQLSPIFQRLGMNPDHLTACIRTFSHRSTVCCYSCFFCLECQSSQA